MSGFILLYLESKFKPLRVRVSNWQHISNYLLISELAKENLKKKTLAIMMSILSTDLWDQNCKSDSEIYDFTEISSSL